MIPCSLLSSTFSLPPQWYQTLLVSSNPNPTPAAPLSSLPSPSHARCFLLRCRRRDSSLDPNAESFRGGRFRFREESGSGGVGGPRRWWSDGSPDGDFEEEFDSIDEEDDDGEQLWDKIWIFKLSLLSKMRGSSRVPAELHCVCRPMPAAGPVSFGQACALPFMPAATAAFPFSGIAPQVSVEARYIA